MEIFPPPLELFLFVSVLVPFFFGIVPLLFLLGAPLFLLLLLLEGEGATLFGLPPLQLTPLNYRVLVILEIPGLGSRFPSLDLGSRFRFLSFVLGSRVLISVLALDFGSRASIYLLGLGLNSRARFGYRVLTPNGFPITPSI